MCKICLNKIVDKIELSLYFERPEPTSKVLDLYLVGYMKAKVEFVDQGDDDKSDAIIADRIPLKPKKELQDMVGRKYTVEQFKKEFGDQLLWHEILDLTQLFYKKLNKISTKMKLYGRELKKFEII